MRLQIQNLGPIKQAEIDLNNRMVVICGPNNTGKTYAAYTMYAIHRAIHRMEIDPSWIQEWDKTLTETLNLEVDLVHWWQQNGQAILDSLAKGLISILPEVFASDSSVFEKTEFRFLLSKEEIVEGFSYRWEFRRTSHYLMTDIKMGSLAISIELKESDPPETSVKDLTLLVRRILELLNFDNSAIFPTERCAIDLFSTDVLLNRSEWLDQALTNGIKDGPKPRAYPLPVQQSLRLVESLVKGKEDSKYADLAKEIEFAVLQGSIEVDEHNNLQYLPVNANNPLRIHLTGSVVKSLYSMVLYLRYKAAYGDLVVIDEPEMNLHPNMQLALTRILAKAANRGLRIVMTTHSDFILREMNNLIMLYPENEKSQALIDRHGFDRDATLDPENVGVYLFQDNTGEQLLVTETGFEVSSIDEAITRQTAISEDIYFELFESN